ncbi:uroporphyrinogen decarboxylase family protein [Chloroflexota bacterium]
MTNKGTMTNEERLRKTIRFEETDKILFAPGIMQFAAKYAGITQQEFMEDQEKADAAFEKTFVDLGGWDVGRPMLGPRPGSGDSGMSGLAMSCGLPGRDFTSNTTMQFIEEEIMKPEDYDYIIDNGYFAFLKLLSERRNQGNPPAPTMSQEEIEKTKEKQEQRINRETEKWNERDVVNLMVGMGSIPPFDIFSINRSVSKFPMDVRRMPDKVKAAIEVSMPEIIENSLKSLESSPVKRISTAASRSSGTFIGTKHFEEFVLPTWLEYVWAMADAGADIVFHCDCDWTRFMPYFKEFPAKRCLLQLDGATDIWKAREILKDHMAIQGDVPAPLLTLGTPDEVFSYCKKLIDELGKEGGGFMLAAGCCTPDQSNIENVRAMARAGNEETWL